MKQTLKLYNSKIIAPDYCPYSIQENDTHFVTTKDTVYLENTDLDIFTVNPSLCPLCKLCQFEPYLKLEDTIDIKTEEFIKYLTLINTEVSKLIVRQFTYLQKDNRLPISIFISPVIFDSMLK